MLPVRSLARAAPLVNALVQKRAMNTAYSGVIGPARVKVSFAEKVILGTIMSVSYCVVPAWVLLNLRAYKGEE